MNHLDLLSQIARSSGFKDKACRLLPTSFDPADTYLRGYPIANTWSWPSCERVLKEFSSIGVMMRLPLFWQLEVPLYNACKSAGAYLFVSDVGNMPLAIEALRTAGIDTVITDNKDADELSHFLREKIVAQPEHMILIYKGELPNAARLSIEGAHVSREVHLFPGTPILEQCATLRSEQPSFFHLIQHVSWDETHQTISMNETCLFPLMQYELPFQLARHGTCSCGRLIVG